MSKSQTVLLLLAVGCVMLLGCISTVNRDKTIMNRRVPHQLSRDAELWIVVRKPNGLTVEERAVFSAGSWVADQSIIE